MDYDTIKVRGNVPDNLFENSGTGMDRLKTFNVSSAAAIVAAAAGVSIARHGARALSSLCGTIDILESVGVNVDCDVSTVEKSINETGIGVFNGMSIQVHPCGLFRILSQIRFGSTLNIAASLANPASPSYALRGVYSPGMLVPVSRVMKQIGYKSGMVVHGFDSDGTPSMDEISPLGTTQIRFFADGCSDSEYQITPEDFGMCPVKYEDIAPCKCLHDETARFAAVLSARGYTACRDFTCMNSAAILFIAGKAVSLKDGFEKSRTIIENGDAVRKLQAWVNCQRYEDSRGLQRFESVFGAC